MENGKEASILENTKRQANKLLGDRQGLKDLTGKSLQKLKTVQIGDETLESLFELVNTFARMLRAHLNATYKDTPWRTLALLVAGLLYFVNPFDIVPDFIPVAGLLDDLTFLLLILKSIRKDVDLFREWEASLSQAGNSGSQ